MISLNLYRKHLYLSCFLQAVKSDDCETSYHTQSSVLAPHIEKLPLPEDCCLTELRELTSTYIDELAQL